MGRRDCLCPVVLTRGADQNPVSTKFDLRSDPVHSLSITLSWGFGMQSCQCYLCYLLKPCPGFMRARSVQLHCLRAIDVSLLVDDSLCHSPLRSALLI